MNPSEPFTPAPRFSWPGGARCAVMLCFDVDGETTALEQDPHAADRVTTWSQCTYGPRVGAPRILGLLDHLGVGATFFIPAYIARNHQAMTRAVVSCGHEIGAHGDIHERLHGLSRQQEAEILRRSIGVLEEVAGKRPIGYRAPWFELNPWTPELLMEHGFEYCASGMGDDIPYQYANGMIEIPGQWMLEDWEQFAFNADPAWGSIPQNCSSVYDLWWREFEAMHRYGCCFVLTLHPWLSGRPSRVQLLERLIRDMRAMGDVWFAQGHEIAAWYRSRMHEPGVGNADFKIHHHAPDGCR
jgi:peptidoglycan/xylan/chitin deacetylase (PgdA/CDA1 family)